MARMLMLHAKMVVEFTGPHADKACEALATQVLAHYHTVLHCVVAYGI